MECANRSQPRTNRPAHAPTISDCFAIGKNPQDRLTTVTVRVAPATKELLARMAHCPLSSCRVDFCFLHRDGLTFQFAHPLKFTSAKSCHEPHCQSLGFVPSLFSLSSTRIHGKTSHSKHFYSGSRAGPGFGTSNTFAGEHRTTRRIEPIRKSDRRCDFSCE